MTHTSDETITVTKEHAAKVFKEELIKSVSEAYLNGSINTLECVITSTVDQKESGDFDLDFLIEMFKRMKEVLVNAKKENK